MDRSVYHTLSGKWLIKIILSLPEKGSRFTPLEKKLEISPSRLVDNLNKLESMNLIKHLSSIDRRHPLLPEYVFTDLGLKLKKDLIKISQYENLLPFFLYEKWTLLVLLTLTKDVKFNNIKNTLSITPKVLSNRLQKLIDLSMVDKIVESVSPLEINYTINDKWLKLCKEIINIL